LDRSKATCPVGVSERVERVEETNQKRRRLVGVLDRSAATCPAGVSERVGERIKTHETIKSILPRFILKTSLAAKLGILNSNYVSI